MAKRFIPIALWIAALWIVATAAGAHGGGLDKHGCHHDRKNGGYHCHRGTPPNGTTRPDTNAHTLTNGPGVTPFGNCAQARAAGAAPVRRGDPGYSRRLDRDGDGIGCE